MLQYDVEKGRAFAPKGWFSNVLVSWWYDTDPSSALETSWMKDPTLYAYVLAFADELPKGDMQAVRQKVRRFVTGLPKLLSTVTYSHGSSARSLRNAPKAVRNEVRRALRRLAKTV